MQLSSKRAIITGATSGIGAAITDVFHHRGARILAVDLSARQTAARHPGKTDIIILAKDVGLDDAAEAIVNHALSELGGLDILVICRGDMPL